jgi:hypothetical protein
MRRRDSLSRGGNGTRTTHTTTTGGQSRIQPTVGAMMLRRSVSPTRPVGSAVTPRRRRRVVIRGAVNQESVSRRLRASRFDNDPSAGSPTETLLRLLLPLDEQVWSSSQRTYPRVAPRVGSDPRTSLIHPIGSSDGRCVQRAGT